MIFLTRLNQSPFVVNSDLIEHIEVTPDTVLALTTGEKILVRESAEEVVARTIQFRRSLLASLPFCTPTCLRTLPGDPQPVDEDRSLQREL